jgi:hypothetical protein
MWFTLHSIMLVSIEADGDRRGDPLPQYGDVARDDRLRDPKYPKRAPHG